MKKLLVISLLTAITSFAQADVRVYMEPKLGFGSSGIRFDNGTTSGSQTGVTTFNFGSVFGATSGPLYFGLDTRYDNLSSAYEEGGTAKSLSYLTLGLGLGYTMTYVPLRWTVSLDLRQWGWVDDFNNAFESGGWRIGFGYYISERFLVNFDYSEPYYKNSDTNVAFLPRIYSFNISFPFDFDSPKVPWKERRGYTVAPSAKEDDFGATEAAQAQDELSGSTGAVNKMSDDELSIEGDDLEPMPQATGGASTGEEFSLDEEPAVSNNSTNATDDSLELEDVPASQEAPAAEEDLEGELDF